MTHLSDSQLIQYLAAQETADAHKILQGRIARGLMYRRTGRQTGMYRTLLVVDEDLVRASKYDLSVFTEDLRGKDHPSSEGRNALEDALARAGHAHFGEVIIYCPSEKMQAKEIDVRLEIKADSVLPLRELAVRNEFVDLADVDALRRHYEQLWRAYIFVAPEVFEDENKCRGIVDRFCEEYSIPFTDAYKKVRTHRFVQQRDDGSKAVLAAEKKPADLSVRPEAPISAAPMGEKEAWQNNEIHSESRTNLLKFARKAKLADTRRDEIWKKHLEQQEVAGQRSRAGARSEKDWAEFERDEREPGLLKDE
jgi:hypothetical protein